DFEEVAKLLEKARKLDRKNLDVRFKLGWVYLEKLHDAHAAYPHLAAVVKRRPNDVDARKLCGLAASQIGHLRMAVKQFREASLLQPQDLWIRANLARALARRERFSEASTIYDDILKTDPANFDARLGQAEFAASRRNCAGPRDMPDRVAYYTP